MLVHLIEKAQRELQQCTARQQMVAEIILNTFTKGDRCQLEELLIRLDQDVATKEV